MVDLIGKWLLIRYAKLWNNLSKKKFGFKEAVDILDEDSKKVGAVLSQLYERGWVTRKKNPNDQRKRIYSLKTPEKIVEQLGKS